MYREGLTRSMLIDSHAHLDFYTERPADRDQVLSRAWDAGVPTILAIGIGQDPSQMHLALDLATTASGPNRPRIFATAGIHPEQAHNATPQPLSELTHLAYNPRCIAIGEIGL